MKKINLFLTILAAAAGFTNCAKVDLVENKEAGNGGTVVCATTDAVTKTTLASDYKVLWSTGDQIKFIKDGASSTTYTFTLSSGSGTSNGTFTCGETPVEGTYTVYYPATYDGTNWPAQTYVSATDISGAPMKATATVGSDGSVSDIAFANEGGILRYTVKGSKTIKSIKVKSASPALDVTLDCGTSGVALTAEGTVFNIALPAGTYSDATLTFTATDKSKATKAASSFAVTKNVVSLATFESSALSFIAPPAPDGFVDLGVTDASGNPLYWAKCNLGATKAEDTGDYFAWGETAPYYTTTGGWPATPSWKSGKEAGYNVTSYCGGSSFVEWSPLPYDATSKILLPAYDAATAANPSWRTPTADEFSALVTNCVWIWTDDYNGTGKAGYIVYKAKTNADKGKANMGGTWKKWDASQSKYVTEGASDATGYTTSDTHIFFLIAGRGGNTSLRKTTDGYYCSSTLYKNTEYSFVLYFNSAFIYPRYESEPRHRGFSVRPVTTEGVAPAPTPTTTGTAKRTGNIDVNWVQLWEDGPKFAEYNVGVTDGKAENYGGYYNWGMSEVQTSSNCNNYKSGTDPLSGADDTATNLWGSNWRMPTKAELEALLSSCDVEWMDGSAKKYNNTTVKGLLCTGKGDYASNSVFLPAAGCCSDGLVSGQSSRGIYWSSTPGGSDEANALDFDSGSQYVYPYGHGRDFGSSVRAVLAE